MIRHLPSTTTLSALHQYEAWQLTVRRAPEDAHAAFSAADFNLSWEAGESSVGSVSADVNRSDTRAGGHHSRGSPRATNQGFSNPRLP